MSQLAHEHLCTGCGEYYYHSWQLCKADLDRMCGKCRYYAKVLENVNLIPHYVSRAANKGGCQECITMRYQCKVYIKNKMKEARERIDEQWPIVTNA